MAENEWLHPVERNEREQEVRFLCALLGPERVAAIAAVYAAEETQRLAEAPARGRAFVEAFRRVVDPVGCPACGLMAGCCPQYPNCPAGAEKSNV